MLKIKYNQKVQRINTIKHLLPVFLLIFAALSVVGFSGLTASAAKPDKGVTIQSGTLVDSTGTLITTGYDSWGYNYQAHMFNGKYCDSYRNAAWCQAYADDNLSMKWNDAWISNVDRTGDGHLDSHFGFASYKGSGAWLTNHMSGVYTDENGAQKWNEFTKIVAAPTDANLIDGVWYAADGTEIGPVIWGEFAIIQDVYNDTGTGNHGLSVKSELRSGLGNW